MGAQGEGVKGRSEGRKVHPELFAMLRQRQGRQQANHSIRELWYNTYWKDHSQPPTKPKTQTLNSTQPTGLSKHHLPLANHQVHPHSLGTEEHHNQSGVSLNRRKNSGIRATSCRYTEGKRYPGIQSKVRDIRSANFYTAVTRNPYHKASQGGTKFDALTRVMVPAPQWFDPSPPQQKYENRTQIEDWKAQVMKIVPPRPQYSVPVDESAATKQYAPQSSLRHSIASTDTSLAPAIRKCRASASSKCSRKGKRHVAINPWVETKGP